MDDALKPVLARQMENYAGFLEYADHHVGRADRRASTSSSVLDDTLVYYIIGDNGASAEGTITGTFNAMIGANGGADLQTTEFMREHIDEIGEPGLLPALRRRLGARALHALPVDQAGRLALGRHAQRHDRPLARPDRGARRAAPPVRHVIDVAPTILEVAGLPEPDAGPRRHPAPDRGHVSMRLQLRRRRRARAPRDAVLRDVLQPRHLPQGLVARSPSTARRGTSATSSCRSTTTSGSSTTARTTGRRRTTSRPSSRTSCTSCSGCS